MYQKCSSVEVDSRFPRKFFEVCKLYNRQSEASKVIVSVV